MPSFNHELFTLTLIADGENSKLLVSTSDEPAKDDEDASGIIYKEDLPELFDEIVNKIPLFRNAEDGSEESVSHSTEDFLNLYDLDLYDIIERGEELLGKDLDNDNEEGESEEHVEKVQRGDADPYGIYNSDINTEDALAHIDPMEALRKDETEQFNDWDENMEF